METAAPEACSPRSALRAQSPPKRLKKTLSFKLEDDEWPPSSSSSVRSSSVRSSSIRSSSARSHKSGSSGEEPTESRSSSRSASRSGSRTESKSAQSSRNNPRRGSWTRNDRSNGSNPRPGDPRWPAEWKTQESVLGAGGPSCWDAARTPAGRRKLSSHDELSERRRTTPRPRRFSAFSASVGFRRSISKAARQIPPESARGSFRRGSTAAAATLLETVLHDGSTATPRAAAQGGSSPAFYCAASPTRSAPSRSAPTGPQQARPGATAGGVEPGSLRSGVLTPVLAPVGLSAPVHVGGRDVTAPTHVGGRESKGLFGRCIFRGCSARLGGCAHVQAAMRTQSPPPVVVKPNGALECGLSRTSSPPSRLSELAFRLNEAVQTPMPKPSQTSLPKPGPGPTKSGAVATKTEGAKRKTRLHSTAACVPEEDEDFIPAKQIARPGSGPAAAWNLVPRPDVGSPGPDVPVPDGPGGRSTDPLPCGVVPVLYIQPAGRTQLATSSRVVLHSAHLAEQPPELDLRAAGGVRANSVPAVRQLVAPPLVTGSSLEEDFIDDAADGADWVPGKGAWDPYRPILPPRRPDDSQRLLPFARAPDPGDEEPQEDENSPTSSEGDTYTEFHTPHTHRTLDSARYESTTMTAREPEDLEPEALQAEHRELGLEDGGLGLEDRRLEDRRLEDRRLEDRRLEDRRLEDRRLEDRRLEDRRLEDREPLDPLDREPELLDRYRSLDREPLESERPEAEEVPPCSGGPFLVAAPSFKDEESFKGQQSLKDDVAGLSSSDGECGTARTARPPDSGDHPYDPPAGQLADGRNGLGPVGTSPVGTSPIGTSPVGAWRMPVDSQSGGTQHSPSPEAAVRCRACQLDVFRKGLKSSRSDCDLYLSSGRVSYEGGRPDDGSIRSSEHPRGPCDGAFEQTYLIHRPHPGAPPGPFMEQELRSPDDLHTDELLSPKVLPPGGLVQESQPPRPESQPPGPESQHPGPESRPPGPESRPPGPESRPPGPPSVEGISSPLERSLTGSPGRGPSVCGSSGRGPSGGGHSGGFRWGSGEAVDPRLFRLYFAADAERSLRHLFGTLCARCQRRLSPFWGGQGRRCHYTNQTFCTACFPSTSYKHVIPNKVITDWDFTPYDVLPGSYRFLKKVADQPWIDITKMHPAIKVCPVASPSCLVHGYFTGSSPVRLTLQRQNPCLLDIWKQRHDLNLLKRFYIDSQRKSGLVLRVGSQCIDTFCTHVMDYLNPFMPHMGWLADNNSAMFSLNDLVLIEEYFQSGRKGLLHCLFPTFDGGVHGGIDATRTGASSPRLQHEFFRRLKKVVGFWSTHILDECDDCYDQFNTYCVHHRVTPLVIGSM
ncbi:hypothetical protein GNI_162960 [Gregarina niphandrodes]|uniref:Rubicon Homology domain-containing protein n=1 Tax=Gregarina niphandrodes TaxID=110365 RepID=A0A023AYC0_GRENI|nr:hypothetical protein GNI_162960 [Gregarina niphandrodes]EZG43667.1 hypothetical protein GNI_162960 [Gregarina niphandrodes]|eukprot:XP_011133100.1 hypothetical protein GNI_162960 [Gregarina niphandrodes]